MQGDVFPMVIGRKVVESHHLFCANVILQERALLVIIDFPATMV